MIRRSKKVIASLLMTLSVVSIFPMTNAFATPQEDMDFLKTCNVAEYYTTQSGMKMPELYEKNGKYYKQVGGYQSDPHLARSAFAGEYYAKEDGTLVANQWAYSRLSEYENYTWRYFGADYKCLKGFQTVNGVRYYFTEGNGDLEIGWFIPKGKAGEWHYSYPDGSIHEGWVETNGKWYYIYADGTMAKNTTTPDGYRVNNKGVFVS